MDGDVKTPDGFSDRDGYSHFKLDGRRTLAETAALIDNAVAFCREIAVERLLVDMSGVTGFPSPTVAERLEFAARWAATSGGRVMLAVVAPPALIDPEKIGVTMASNRGLRSNAFPTEEEATAWLMHG